MNMLRAGDQLRRREGTEIEIIPSNPDEPCLERREVHSGPTGTPIFRLRYTDYSGSKTIRSYRIEKEVLLRNGETCAYLACMKAAKHKCRSRGKIMSKERIKRKETHCLCSNDKH